MPYPAYKDPLWPEPEPDIWRGGRPLAPYRPPVPPLPPAPKPNEYTPWFPEDDLEKQPKANPNTGQPVGPAYTQMPRDMQRKLVDATYGDNVRKISKGPSKDVVSNMLSEGYRSLDTALNGQPDVQKNVSFSTVFNPESPYYLQALRQVPSVATGLRKMSQILEYLPPVKGWRGPSLGKTQGLSKPITEEQRLGLLLNPNATIHGTPAGKWLELGARGPGATIQKFPAHTPPNAVSLAHEGYHSIYALQNPATQAPRATGDRAMQLMARVMNRAGLSEDEILSWLAHYEKEPSHGLVEALAQYAAKKGGMNVK